MSFVLIKYWKQHSSNDSVFINFILKNIWINCIDLNMINETTFKFWKFISQFNSDITQNQNEEDLNDIANADAVKTADESHANQMKTDLKYQNIKIILKWI